MGSKRPEMLTIRKRLVFLFIIILIFTLSLFGRLGWLQLVRGEELRQQAWEQWNRSVPVSAPRGSIRDRNGEILVGSVTADSVIALPGQIESSEMVAGELSRILDRNYEKLKNMLEKDTGQVILARMVDKSKAQHLRALDIPGIKVTTETRRYYPHDRLASQVLGFVGVDHGLGGLEFVYEEELSGKDGWMEFQADGTLKGKELPHGTGRFVPPKDGKDIKTTLDLNVQYILERELERAMVQYDPVEVMATALNPNTGEVLGMAAKPDYYPGEYDQFEAKKRNIPVINKTFEPGSTFKLVTLSASVEENKFDRERDFYCKGSIDVAGTSIGCWSGGHGSIDFLEVVYGSCNPGFVTLGQELGKEKILNYIHGFGFDDRSGIDLPGETTGILFTPSQMGPTELATTSFGQGVSVTPIQQAVAVSAIANGGDLLKPYIGKSIVNESGESYDREREASLGESTKIRQVISSETSRKVTEIMEGVVMEGSGQNAFIEGYRVVGKTGTAQKVGPDGAYIPDEQIASFVGFAPADDPEVLVYVAVDTPKEGPAWGGQVAAPVFKNMMEDILDYKEIAPEYDSIDYEEREVSRHVEVPNLLNLSIDEAREKLELKGLKLELVGEGDRIDKQLPEPGAEVQLQSQIVIYLED